MHVNINCNLCTSVVVLLNFHFLYKFKCWYTYICNTRDLQRLLCGRTWACTRVWLWCGKWKRKFEVEECNFWMFTVFVSDTRSKAYQQLLSFSVALRLLVYGLYVVISSAGLPLASCHSPPAFLCSILINFGLALTLLPVSRLHLSLALPYIYSGLLWIFCVRHF